MVNVPLFAGNPQLQEQLRLQLPVFLQQVKAPGWPCAALSPHAPRLFRPLEEREYLGCLVKRSRKRVGLGGLGCERKGFAQGREEGRACLDKAIDIKAFKLPKGVFQIRLVKLHETPVWTVTVMSLQKLKRLIALEQLVRSGKSNKINSEGVCPPVLN